MTNSRDADVYQGGGNTSMRAAAAARFDLRIGARALSSFAEYV